jgi:quinol-cytochrome oxidoreductase complex cytochrome b subunit
LTSVHRFNQYIIIALVAIHIAAIFFYQVFKKEGLIKPMITGNKKVLVTSEVSVSTESIDTSKQRLAALAIFVAVGVGLYYLIK